MTPHFNRILPLVALLSVSAACSKDAPTAPAVQRSAPTPSLSNIPASTTYTFSLDCRKDASLAGNVGLTVFNASFQTVSIGGLFCGQSVTVGPGAIWMYYNINVYDGYDYLFSCDTGIGYVPVEAGKIRCQIRDAEFVKEERKGIWVTLTIKPT